MDVFIIGAVRTPIGKFLGGLSERTAPELGAAVIREVLQRSQVSADAVDEVIMGEVLQAGVGQNPARQAALQARLPPSIAAYTVNKVCGSGLKAVMLAAQAIRAGDADVIVAGGMESMSNAPHLLLGARQGWKFGEQRVVDVVQQDGLVCPFERWAMGSAADYIADRFSISRAEQDRFAVQSHQRASAARENMQREIVPVQVGSGAKARMIDADEGIRADSSVETLARLRPAFRADGTVTAGNASQLSDGAAAVLVASARAVARWRLKPLARIESYATSGVEPKDIFIAPVSAIQMACERANWQVEAIDRFEINEAFAAQMLACSKELGLDERRLNGWGGGIALGHPIGASGARILTTLLHQLIDCQGERGMASLCLGGGNAVAMGIIRV